MSGCRHWAAAVACLPLVLLAGCPLQPRTSAPGAIPAQATAPAVRAQAKAVPPAPAIVPPQPANPAAQTIKVQQLIRQVEGAYSSGVNNYRNGKLEDARSDFDMAVDLMLTSGMDVKSDPRLSNEFSHLLDRINTLEMSALEQGSGFSAPIEPAPLDAANEVTFPPNAALTAKVEGELKTTQSDFPLVINKYVAGFISYFTNSPTGHAHLVSSLERAGKYKAMISKILRKQGVPQDLIYLAVVESGFQPRVVNRQSGAGGMWQFMPNGSYGLTRNAWVDERFDPEKSSVAYARYIKSLYNQFDNWYLAMAAYDWGPGYVQRSVMRTGYADFWQLYQRNELPQETKNYVPGIIAAIIMAKNPKQYGLENLVPDAPVVYDTVSVDYAVDLRLVADVTGATASEIVGLNPSLLRMTTPDDAEFDLHLPAGTRSIYLKRIQKIPEDKRASWRFHIVHAGESLDSIASTFHTRSEEIASANGLSADASLDAGDELVIPAPVAIAATHPLRYVTRAGDTLGKIADRFNVSVEDLRLWNHLSSSRIRSHRTLYVSQPVHRAPETSRRVRETHHRTSRRNEARRSPKRTTKRVKTPTKRTSKSSAKAPTHRTTPHKATTAMRRHDAR